MLKALVLAVALIVAAVILACSFRYEMQAAPPHVKVGGKYMAILDPQIAAFRLDRWTGKIEVFASEGGHAPDSLYVDLTGEARKPRGRK